MIRADTAGIGNLARDLARVVADVPKAFAQATISVARASKTEAKREITAIYAVKQARVDRGLKVVTGSDFSISTSGSRRRLTLRSFGGRMSANGRYSAQILKGSRRTYDGVFMPQKFGDLPFRRIGKSRLPIDVLRGASVSEMLTYREVKPRFIARQSIRARDELTRRIFRALKGK